MNTLDIAQLVRSALESHGCDPSLISDIDNHSTIVLDLFDLPSIYISVVDEDVWLWASLCDYSDSVLDQRASGLLRALMAGCSFMRTGQLQLTNQDNALVLQGLVHQDNLLDSAKFAESLNEFFNQLEHFCQSLLRWNHFVYFKS
nr:SPI-1 type III secretion system chaperone SpaK [Providencia sp. PROV188]